MVDDELYAAALAWEKGGGGEGATAKECKAAARAARRIALGIRKDAEKWVQQQSICMTSTALLPNVTVVLTPGDIRPQTVMFIGEAAFAGAEKYPEAPVLRERRRTFYSQALMAGLPHLEDVQAAILEPINAATKRTPAAVAAAGGETQRVRRERTPPPGATGKGRTGVFAFLAEDEVESSESESEEGEGAANGGRRGCGMEAANEEMRKQNRKLQARLAASEVLVQQLMAERESGMWTLAAAAEVEGGGQAGASGAPAQILAQGGPVTPEVVVAGEGADEEEAMLPAEGGAAAAAPAGGGGRKKGARRN